MMLVGVEAGHTVLPRGCYDLGRSRGRSRTIRKVGVANRPTILTTFYNSKLAYDLH